MNFRWATVFVTASITCAQSQSGIVTGKVLDSRHLPVTAATVCLQAEDGRQRISQKTDSDGAYRFAVQSGNYTIRLEGEPDAASVTVSGGQVATLNLVQKQVEFFDEPQFSIAGVTDNTYRGGHGSDNVLRSSEDLAKATASLASKDSNGKVLKQLEHPLEDLKALQQAAELDPTEANLFDLGTELLSHRAAQAAAAVFKKGVRLFPNSSRMLLGLASSKYELGSYDAASTDFFRATDIVPSERTPYLFLAKVKAREITTSPGYEERMERFAKLNPADALANYYYAVCLKQVRTNEARALLQKAIALDPHMADAYLGLGEMQASDGNHAQAIDSYRKAIDQAPSLEEAHYRLSEAYRITGDRAGAEREIAIYNKLARESAEKVEHERREVQQFVIGLRQANKP